MAATTTLTRSEAGDRSTVPRLENGDRLTRAEWWEWREGEYVSLPIERGVIRSRLFPGLRLEVAALVAGRSADVLAELKRGLASEEHAAFAAELGARLR